MSRKLVAWPDVLRVVQRDETRSLVLERFRSSGFSADSFGRSAKSRVAAADALTAAEDWLEMNRPGAQDERSAIRDVRRRLELEGELGR